MEESSHLSSQYTFKFRSPSEEGQGRLSLTSWWLLQGTDITVGFGSYSGLQKAKTK